MKEKRTGTGSTKTGFREEWKHIIWLSKKDVSKQVIGTGVITALMTMLIALADSGAIEILGRIL